LVQFWEFAARLKAEPRRGWLKRLRLQRTESVADHSFALSLLCLFEGERRSYNVERLLKLALLHDLEEAITGDLTPEDKEARGENIAKAQKISAREQLISYFPLENQRSYRELWSELENESSREAQLVHELDKLELALQCLPSHIRSLEEPIPAYRVRELAVLPCCFRYRAPTIVLCKLADSRVESAKSIVLGQRFSEL